LEEGWREIFILSAAQFQMPLDLAPLLAHAGLTPETCSSDKLIKLMSEMRNFQDIISKFKQSQVDPTEYACLKAITLFKTGKNWQIK
jgi:nuclear receptor subfamily 2 group E protein 1